MQGLFIRFAPYWLQNLAISFYNWRAWKRRQSKKYWKMRQEFAEQATWTQPRLEQERDRRLREFIAYARQHSPWFRQRLVSDSLDDCPLLEKRDLVEHLDAIATIPESKALVSVTGGTTGASMKVLYLHEDQSERIAMLDWFRSLYGYEPGKRTAWFSGKVIATEEDVRRGYCFRDDWIYKTRFFSTFHINADTFESYWNALVEFQPEFVVGFPSSVFEICMVAKQRGLRFPGSIAAFFPTAETVLPAHREVIAQVLGCEVKNQYASSEGAPFIIECPSGKLHIHPTSGIFEVLDDDMKPARQGELVVTAFPTRGTPLIRYRIGDHVTLGDQDETCTCGWHFPIVRSVDGRTQDFVWSPRSGRVNLGNLSNSTKGIEGIIQFQVMQDVPDAFTVNVLGTELFDQAQESKFRAALLERMGDGFRITIRRVDEIARAPSGKFRIVHNNVKREQMVLVR